MEAVKKRTVIQDRDGRKPVLAWKITAARQRRNRGVGSTAVPPHLFKIVPNIRYIASLMSSLAMGSSTMK
jgi:hypothetical protein